MDRLYCSLLHGGSGPGLQLSGSAVWHPGIRQARLTYNTRLHLQHRRNDAHGVSHRRRFNIIAWRKGIKRMSWHQMFSFLFATMMHSGDLPALWLLVCLSSTAALDLASSSPGCWWEWSLPSSWLEETWRSLFVILSTPKNSLRQVFFLFAASKSTFFYSLSVPTVLPWPGLITPVLSASVIFQVVDTPYLVNPEWKNFIPGYMYNDSDLELTAESFYRQSKLIFMYLGDCILSDTFQKQCCCHYYSSHSSTVLSVFLHLHLVTKLKGFLS